MKDTKIEVGLTHFYISETDQKIFNTALFTLSKIKQLFNEKIGNAEWEACDGYGNAFTKQELDKTADVLYALAYGHEGEFLVE